MQEMVSDVLKLVAMYFVVSLPGILLAIWVERREGKRKRLAFIEFEQRLLQLGPDAQKECTEETYERVRAISEELKRKYCISDLHGFEITWENGRTMQIQYPRG